MTIDKDGSFLTRISGMTSQLSSNETKRNNLKGPIRIRWKGRQIKLRRCVFINLLLSKCFAVAVFILYIYVSIIIIYIYTYLLYTVCVLYLLVFVMNVSLNDPCALKLRPAHALVCDRLRPSHVKLRPVHSQTLIPLSVTDYDPRT
jgi:hypothetical protein